MFPRIKTPNFPCSPLLHTVKPPRDCCVALRRVRNQSAVSPIPTLATDIGAYRRRIHSISQSLRKNILKYDETFNEIQAKERKKAILRLIRKNLGVKIPIWDLFRLTEDEITKKAVFIRAMRIAKKAAKCLKNWLKIKKLTKAMEIERIRLHLAAFRIQKYWKNHFVFFK